MAGAGAPSSTSRRRRRGCARIALALLLILCAMALQVGVYAHAKPYLAAPTPTPTFPDITGAALRMGDRFVFVPTTGSAGGTFVSRWRSFPPGTAWGEITWSDPQSRLHAVRGGGRIAPRRLVWSLGARMPKPSIHVAAQTGTGRATVLVFHPAYLWAPALATLGLAGVRWFSRRHTRGPGKCRNCGYDIRGIKAGKPCPECGAER